MWRFHDLHDNEIIVIIVFKRIGYMFIFHVDVFQLPNIAKGLGKKAFKMYLESFFDAIFYSLVI